MSIKIEAPHIKLMQLVGGSPVIVYPKSIVALVQQAHGTKVLLTHGHSVVVLEQAEYVEEMRVNIRVSAAKKEEPPTTIEGELLDKEEPEPVQAEIPMEEDEEEDEPKDKGHGYLTVRTQQSRLMKYARLISKDKALNNLRMTQMFFEGADESICDYIANINNVSVTTVKTAIVAILDRVDDVTTKECAKKGRFKKMLRHCNKDHVITSLKSLDSWLQVTKI